MYKNLSITALLGIVAIVLGAFASHSLKSILSTEELQSFQTAVRYQFWHVLALLFVNMFQGFSTKQKNIISYIFFAGILCFSGSIYAIYLLHVPAKSIWFITPLGGVLMIIGWIVMLTVFIRKSYQK